MSFAKRRNPGTSASLHNDSGAPPLGSGDRSWNDVFQAMFGEGRHRLFRQLRTPRVWLLAAAHAVIFAAAYWTAFWLRFDLAVPKKDVAFFCSTLGWVVGIQLLVF